MPLKSPFSKKLIAEDFADNSPLVNRFRTFHNQRTLDSIKHRMAKYIEQRPNTVETGFTQFGIALGEKAGQMPNTDYEYCWNKAIECFGDNDDTKRFLGSMLMQAFANDDQNWLFIQDPDKKEKLRNGETPLATKYWLDLTGKGYEDISTPISATVDNKRSNELFTNVNSKTGTMGTMGTTSGMAKPAKGMGTTPTTLADLAQKFNRKIL